MMSRLTGKTKKKKLYYFFQLLPFANRPLKTCNQDISKIIMPRSLKFGQRIQDGEIMHIDKLMVEGTLFH